MIRLIFFTLGLATVSVQGIAGTSRCEIRDELRARLLGKTNAPATRQFLTEPKGEPTNLGHAFERIKNLPKFPFDKAGGHWVKTSDGSYLHTWFESALLPNGTLKMTPSPTVVLQTGLSGRARDTYLSGYVDELRLQGLNVAFVEGNGDGWTELFARYQAYHGQGALPDRYAVRNQANNLVEAVEGLEKVLRARNRLTGPTQFNLVGNSYGAWVAQAVASGEKKNFFQNYILLGPGTESLHRSNPGVREFEDFVDCLADRYVCETDSILKMSDFVGAMANVFRDAQRTSMELSMNRYLPSFFKSHFPIFRNDPIRLESAIRKFKGIWTFDTKKVASQMRGVTLITARHDAVMPANEGIIVQDELGKALKGSQEFKGHIEIGDADHDFLSTGKKDPIFNKTAVLIGNVIRGDGPVAKLPKDGSKMVIESLQDLDTIRPANRLESHERPPVQNASLTMQTNELSRIIHRWEEYRDELLNRNSSSKAH